MDPDPVQEHCPLLYLGNEVLQVNVGLLQVDGVDHNLDQQTLFQNSTLKRFNIIQVKRPLFIRQIQRS